MAHAQVYVDGACRNNGHNNPQGGCGVFWDNMHPLNSAERLGGEKQTNNRAELSSAIMAVAQGITLGYPNIEIITDSRYVKEGITKWIHEWKLNNWKTSRTGKKKGDVLNKDLWVMLDALANQLNIQWTWVEGHQEVEGNLQADTLAKKGISTERYVWQDIALNLFRNTNDNTFNSNENSTETSGSGELSENTKFPCKKCHIECVEGGNCIQCQDCKGWLHYSCSQLPSYQLYLYESTQRKYTCEFCADVNEEYELNCNIKHHSHSSTQDQISTVSNASPLLEVMLNPKPTPSDSSAKPSDNVIIITKCQQESRASQTDEILSISDSKACQTMEILTASQNEETFHILESKSCQTEEPYYDFELFRTSSIALLQESFVSAFDKINDSIRTMKSTQSDENEMKQRMTLLMKENEKLKESKIEAKVTQKAKLSCTSCSDATLRIEKLQKQLDKEKENSQQCLHKFTVEKEMQISKLNAEICTLRHQIELSSRQYSAMEADLSSMEKRIQVKNDYISSIEEQKYTLSQKINCLQDEIMSWKLHDCRANGEPFQQVKGKHENQANKKSGPASVIEIQSDSEEILQDKPPKTATITEGVHDNQRPLASSIVEDSQGTLEGEDSVIQDINLTPTNETTGSTENHISRKTMPQPPMPTVQMVGTSNIKYISPDYIGDSKFKVSKITKYTLNETFEYIQKMTPADRQDAFILHLLCNDAGSKTPDECTDNMIDIIDSLTQKYTDTKIIISLGLPQSNVMINRSIEKINLLIKEKASDKENVFVCDNSNLFYRGGAQKGVLKEDGLHLTRAGTRKLGRNIKEALWDAFDTSSIIGHDKNSENGSQDNLHLHLTDKERRLQRFNDESRRPQMFERQKQSPNYTSGEKRFANYDGERRLQKYDMDRRSQYLDEERSHRSKSHNDEKQPQYFSEVPKQAQHYKNGEKPSQNNGEGRTSQKYNDREKQSNSGLRPNYYNAGGKRFPRDNNAGKLPQYLDDEIQTKNQDDENKQTKNYEGRAQSQYCNGREKRSQEYDVVGKRSQIYDGVMRLLNCINGEEESQNYVGELQSKHYNDGDGRSPNYREWEKRSQICDKESLSQSFDNQQTLSQNYDEGKQTQNYERGERRSQIYPGKRSPKSYNDLGQHSQYNEKGETTPQHHGSGRWRQNYGDRERRSQNYSRMLQPQYYNGGARRIHNYSGEKNSRNYYNGERRSHNCNNDEGRSPYYNGERQFPNYEHDNRAKINISKRQCVSPGGYGF